MSPPTLPPKKKAVGESSDAGAGASSSTSVSSAVAAAAHAPSVSQRALHYLGKWYKVVRENSRVRCGVFFGGGIGFVSFCFFKMASH